jgi:uncharacterized OB-fold protein
VSAYKGFELLLEASGSEYAGYFKAARQGKLVVQRCNSCQMIRVPISAACPFCMTSQWAWCEVSGRGMIYSYGIVALSVLPAFDNWVPYPLVLVELDEQPSVPWRDWTDGEFRSLRMVANLVRRDDPTSPEREELVTIGSRVEVCFVDLDDNIALPQFRLSDTQ